VSPPRHSRRAPAAWDAETLCAPHARRDKPTRVEAMFDAIAPTYERVNTLATFGRDAVWRRRTVAAAGVRAGDIVLDLCCGTGDMLRAFAANEPTPKLIIGVDFAERMLVEGVARTVPGRARLLRADALRLPLANESVDVISCAFGVRNFGDLQAGLDEMYRVARPEARVVILEFALPRTALLRRAYRFYCDVVLPRLGAAISGDRVGAYRYLPRSIQTFEDVAALVHRLTSTGFANVTVRRMNFGGVALYRAEKPPPGAGG